MGMSETSESTPPEPPKLKLPWYHFRLRTVVIAHVVLSVVSWILFRIFFQSLVIFSLYYVITNSHFWLIAIWGGLGRSSLGKRFAGAIGLLFYLFLIEFLFYFLVVVRLNMIIFGFGLFIHYLICMATAVGVFLFIRRRKCKLRKYKREMLVASDKPYQFTIRSIILLTVAIALVLTFGKIIRAIDLDTIPSVEAYWFSPFAILRVGVSILCFVPVCVATVWATLSRKHPTPRILVVLTFALCVGLVPPFYFSREGLNYILGPLSMLLTSLTVMGTLLVVRSWGYRFVPFSRSKSDGPPTKEFSGIPVH